MSTPARKTLGRWGERAAAEYLHRHGYQVIALNARTAYGEIDIVARQDVVTVFVEVKTRRTTTYGHPEESITKTKRQHMIQSAEDYIQAHPELGCDWRIDVIAIMRQPDNTPEIIHFENAIT